LCFCTSKCASICTFVPAEGSRRAPFQPVGAATSRLPTPPLSCIAPLAAARLQQLRYSVYLLYSYSVYLLYSTPSLSCTAPLAAARLQQLRRCQYICTFLYEVKQVN
jgi:hypothetical protein